MVIPVNEEPIKHWTPFGGGSSRVGISDVLSVLKCARRHKLDKEAHKKGQFNSWDAPPIWTGSMLHYLLEQYYRGESPHLELDDLAESTMVTCWKNAWQAFRQYRAEFPSDEFGKDCLIETELPQTPEQSERLQALFGIDYSCKFDLVFTATEEVCNQLSQTRDITLLPYHTYIVDHKSVAFLYPQWRRLFKDSLQFMAYALAYQEIYPERVFGGVIANVIGVKGEKIHRSLLITPPGVEEFQLVLSTINQYKERIKQYPCNPTQCHFPTLCPWLGNKCERY